MEIKAIHDANHDALTDLPNRILFRDRVEQALHTARREGRICVVLDLDCLKEINGEGRGRQESLPISGVWIYAVGKAKSQQAAYTMALFEF